MAAEDPNALGRIALKQVRVSRADLEAREAARNQSANSSSGARKAGNPMNRLVPYLDLFGRLSDEELARLARAPQAAVEGLRQQIDDVNRALGRFADLLPRLNDEELSRLTGASTKTIRFWRLSQPRHLQGDTRRPSNTEHNAAQPVPRQETSETSSSSPSRRSQSGAHPTGAHPSVAASAAASADQDSVEVSFDDPEPSESSTFVIDTVE